MRPLAPGDDPTICADCAEGCHSDCLRNGCRCRHGVRGGVPLPNRRRLAASTRRLLDRLDAELRAIRRGCRPRTRIVTENPANRLTLDVDHVTYNIGTLDALDFNLRNCLPSHRDALLDARQSCYPDAPTEGQG